MSSNDINGTWYIYKHYARDEYGNTYEKESSGSSTTINSSSISIPNALYLGASDKEAPVISNLAMSSSVSEITNKTTVFITGQIKDTLSNLDNFNVQIKHAKSGVTKYLSGNIDNDVDANGLFTISQELSSSDPNGTWYIYRHYSRDKAGNTYEKETSGLESAFDTLSMTNSQYSGSDGGDLASSVDKLAPAPSNVVLSVVDDSGTKKFKISVDVANDPYATTWSNGYVYLKNLDVPSQNEIHVSLYDSSNGGGTANDGTFTNYQDATSYAPGTYIISRISMRDDTGNEYVESTNSGTSLFGTNGTTTLANSPTSITLSASSVNEETLGITVAKIQVNGTDAGSLYNFTIGGDDASLLEVSSLGYLKLKAASKLDYETDAQLNFTLTATNELSVAKTTSFSLTVNDVTEAVSSSINLIGIEGLLLDPVDSSIQFNPDNGSKVTIGSTEQDESEALSELGIIIDLRGDYEVAESESESNELEEFWSEMTNDEQIVGAVQTDQLLVSGLDDLDEEILFINEIV
jgi:hypothetical protein